MVELIGLARFHSDVQNHSVRLFWWPVTWADVGAGTPKAAAGEDGASTGDRNQVRGNRLAKLVHSTGGLVSRSYDCGKADAMKR
ncbi:MAG: hypothetical protein AAF714_00400 [Pseudomonadota bacterium]